MALSNFPATASEASSSVSSIEIVRSLASDEAGILPHDVDPIFQFEDLKLPGKIDEAPKPSLPLAPPLSLVIETAPGYLQRRVFLNCVDSFNMKYIARFLSEKVVGSLRAPEEFVADEELGLEEEEGVEKRKKEEAPKYNYKIIGSLLEPNGEYEKGVVSEIVDTSDKKFLLRKLKTCGFIVYDISRNPSQIEEARWVLHAIEEDLEEKKRKTPKAFEAFQDISNFILISTFMTWTNTKPVDVEDPKAPFRESNFRKRKCHPNFREHANLERELDDVGKKFPDKFRTLVLCSGLQYGFEEDSLNFLFKMAWENEPALPLYLPGKNYIPLMHIQDLATMVFSLLEEFPDSSTVKYLLAVEQEMSNLKSITKAISKGLTTGDLVKVPKEEMRASQHTYDCLTSNVRMEPTYFVEKGITWTTPASFPQNIQKIIQEYRESRHLTAIRILVTGPPASGKTTLAKNLCEHYQLHYLTPQEITDRYIQRIKYKIDKLKAKEMAELAKELEEEEEEEDEGEGEGEEEELEEEEEEEEDTESPEELAEMLDALTLNMMENDGRLDQERLLNCLRSILASPPIQNQGYVLDNFPDTIPHLKKVFKSEAKRPKGEDDVYGGEEEIPEEEFVAPEDEEEEILPDAAPYPEFVIGLEASDKYILNRVMELSEEKTKELMCGEEEIKVRLASYRAENTEEAGFLNFLDEKDVHPIIIEVEEDKSHFFSDTLEKLKSIIGEPHNFGLSSDELEALERETEEQRLMKEYLEEERKRKVEKEANEERQRRIDLWEATKDELNKADEEKYKTDRLAFRQYLKTFIYPTLIPGLKDVARERIGNPVDYMAEYLLKENPEMKLFDPEKPRATRKAFGEMHKSRDTLFSIDALDRSTQEEFYPDPGDATFDSLMKEAEMSGEE